MAEMFPRTPHRDSLLNEGLPNCCGRDAILLSEDGQRRAGVVARSCVQNLNFVQTTYALLDTVHRKVISDGHSVDAVLFSQIPDLHALAVVIGQLGGLLVADLLGTPGDRRYDTRHLWPGLDFAHQGTKFDGPATLFRIGM